MELCYEKSYELKEFKARINDMRERFVIRWYKVLENTKNRFSVEIFY